MATRTSQRRTAVVARSRQIFSNRTLNLRSIRAIGYDMDYTLIHYRVDRWEERAYQETRKRLAARGWPVDHLTFDPDSVIRGLTIDLELGNLVKPTRFGYVIRAAHGTRFLEFEEVRRSYAGTLVDLAEDRFVFLNTLFSLSEAALFAQLVDLRDKGELSDALVYGDLYRTVRDTLDATHMEGTLKAEITERPEDFVVPDPEVPLALLDQRYAGKRLMLITNSEWSFTRKMMEYTFDPHLPDGTTWRDLFHAVITGAAKPGFFTEFGQLYEIVDEEAGLLRPNPGPLDRDAVYHGGCATGLEEYLGLHGDEILYVGDHLYSDVHVTKAVLRWRTALILREMETEVEALDAFREREQRLGALMASKEGLEQRLAPVRLERQRESGGYAAATGGIAHDAVIDGLRREIAELDEVIGPLAKESGELRNPAWGPLMRSGQDKSLFARQVERYADVYTSRVSNFLSVTPFGYIRAARSGLPHDPD